MSIRPLPAFLFAAAGGLLLAQLAAPPAKPGGAGAAKAKAKTVVAKKAETSDAVAVSGDLSLGLRFGPPGSRGLRPLPAASFTLPNGVKVLTVENRESPMVHLFALVRAGAAAEPAGKTGLASIAARMVRTGGTAALAAPALEERLAALGVTLEATALDTRAQFVWRAPTDSFSDGAAILRDMLTAPRFDADAFDQSHEMAMSAVAERSSGPGLILSRVFREKVFGPASALSRQPGYDSLEKIAHADVVAFHRRHYRPEGTVIAIESDLSAAEMKLRIEGLFGAWKTAESEAAPATVEAPAPAPSASLSLADRAEARQSAVVIGHVGGRAADPDYGAMLLVCEMLNANLPRRVREAGGWRADWSAVWEPGFDRPGEFMVRALVEGPYTPQAIQIAKDEINRYRSGQFTDRELEVVRTGVLTRFALRLQATSDQLLERSLAEFYGVPADLPASTYTAVATATRADVAKAAAARLLPAQTIAVIGSASLFDKPLTTILARVEPIDLTIARPTSSKTQNDPESLARGKEALALMQKALGGADKLAAVQDASIRYEGTVAVNGTPTPLTVHDRWMQGDIYRQDQSLKNGVPRSFFYNGRIAWLGVPGYVDPMSPDTLAQVRGEIFRLLFRLALSDRDSKRQVAAPGGNVILVNEGDKYSVRIHVDPQTHLPQRLLSRWTLASGAVVSIEESLSNWKEFDGVQWPTHIETRRNGRKSDDVTVVEARFNSGLKAADLERKP
ncbi:MAG: insulinase family protein [Bryobacterales bacterium]|nr:insulinase family protein [Bryobacterales bacterium]